MIRHTSSKHAPWIVVPADNKWFARLVVSSVIVHALEDMKLSYPAVSDEKRRALAAARRELEGKVKAEKDESVSAGFSCRAGGGGHSHRKLERTGKRQ